MKSLLQWTSMVMLAATQLNCATIFNGTKDTITIRSNVKGTTFYVNEAEVGTDSAVALVSKKGDALIRASKVGCRDAVVPVPTEFDPVSLLGIFLDLGLVSMLLIDGAATGAITKASQTNFVVTPVCE